jgi:membrane dipeptidase
MPRPDRLIDLHCDWPLQYAPETTVFDPALYGEVVGRLGQVEGYLQDTSASVVACFRRAGDWARQADPWAALGALIARIEAEFPGRLLIGPDDFARWSDEPDGLCWAVMGVEGFDALIRSPADLDRLPGLFARGVRVFQPSYTSKGVLAGSSEPGDDRGWTDLGRAFLQALADLAPTPAGPRPVLDLAHLNPHAMSEALAWYEADASRPDRLVPAYTHGALRHEQYASRRAISLENLARLRALGGFTGISVGPPFYLSPESLRRGLEAAASCPFRGRPGFDGIAIGTDFLGVNETLPKLRNVGEVVAWLSSSFDPGTAETLISGSGRRLIAAVTGADRA